MAHSWDTWIQVYSTMSIFECFNKWLDSTTKWGLKPNLINYSLTLTRFNSLINENITQKISMEQKFAESKKFTVKVIVTFLILILIFGLIYWWAKPSGGFNTQDPEVQTIIGAIVRFEKDNNHPPDSLDELVPEYLNSLILPENVFNIEYEVQPENNSWQIIFDSGCGFKDTYYSKGNWSFEFPPPDFAVDCYKN